MSQAMRMTGSDEGDLRFQFEVIKNLADSVRGQTDVMRGIQADVRTLYEAQSKTNERLASIEANRVNETVAKIEARLEAQAEKIDKLESERDRRAGGNAFARGIQGWWPAFAGLFTVVFLILRAVGIIHLPSDAGAK